MASDAFPRVWCPPRAFVRRLLLVLVLPAGGCSADVTRFDFPAFATADNGSTRPTGALPTPPEPVWPRNTGYAPRTSDGLAPPPREAGLSDAPPERADAMDKRSGFVRGYQHQDEEQTRPAVPGRYALADRPPASRDQPPANAGGETVEVQPGDTLYAIARRHGVPVGALIERNHLADGASLRPGQQLVLPAGAASGRAVAARAASPPVSQADPPPGWDGQHTLQAGESLYAVARQYRVELAELQRVNGIAPLAAVRAGTVLRVPRGAEPAAAQSDAAPERPGGPPVQARIINQPEEVRTAALGNHATDATAAPAGGELGGKFRWPVRGRVIVAFGARPDGTRNDGINIAVPVGTEIHAAEAGRVAYAGSELKGYGNLVLIRHDGGWVSAYAHADQILVKRDDVVRRGQVIARAGKTGSVDQPQLHFELRQGAKPVDPLPHMEPN